MTHHSPEPTLLSRACPVCANGTGERLFQQSFKAIDESSFVHGYDVVVCDACGFGFADGIPEQHVFDDHYARMSRYEYHQRAGEESAFDRERLESIVATIDGLVPARDARVIDVGCANGRLLGLLKEAGYEHVEGLDPSAACAATARKLYGVDVGVGTIGHLAGSQTFDVVIALGVLEHIREVADAMRILTSALALNGRMYLAVPDAEALADWPNAAFQAFSNEHINFFSRESLANLGRRHGLVPVFTHSGAFAQGRGTSEPWVAVAFAHNCHDAGSLVRDEITRPALLRYIAHSRAEEARIHEIVHHLVATQRPVIVWGTGTHTTRLLAVSPLANAKIAAYVDSNAHYQGKHLGGVPIISPGQLRDRPEPILISSRMFQDEIASQIRHELALPNELICLYDL